MTFSVILLVVVTVWLCILTAIVVWIFKTFKKLTENINVGNIEVLLGRLFEKEEENTKRIAYFAREINEFREESTAHIRKFGFVRFNPFNDMGGDHSFSLALLDGRNTGFVLTGLHTRDRTRVYVKYVKRGKSEYDLSKEEKKAVEQALKKG